MSDKYWLTEAQLQRIKRLSRGPTADHVSMTVTNCDSEGRPIILLLSEGQMSDDKGACLVLDVDLEGA